MLRFSLVSLFPEFFDGALRVGQVRRALESGGLSIDMINPRRFAPDRYGTVDDKSYGGGSGMVLQCAPLVACLEEITRQKTLREARTGCAELLRVIVLSPRGRTWDQARVEEEAGHFNSMHNKNLVRHFVLVCGRYEGVDERFQRFFADEEVSVGPYVLNGGEVAAWTVLESLVRFFPGVVGKEESLRLDSFSKNPDGVRRLDWPHFTTPAEFRGLKVPDVLQSGHHARIEAWRRAQAEGAKP